jgi:site-specific recombinase XerD
MGKSSWRITADKFLSEEQVQRLLAYLLRERDLAFARDENLQAIRDYYMVHCLIGSGVRVAEFCKLSHADFNGQKLIVREGKGKKNRTILLTRKTMEVLREWTAVKERLALLTTPDAPLFPSRYDRRYSVRGVQKRIKLILAAAQLPTHYSVHSLRHTYCSMLLSTGRVGVQTARENMGHSTLAITNLYAHAIGKIDEDVELLSDRDPSAEKYQKDELSQPSRKKKANDLVSRFLGKANFKRNDPTSGGNHA